ncbi:MAG TPA: dihydrofolate reductase [Steroidobacteraceae bacterium]
MSPDGKPAGLSISLMVARATNGVIGNGNALPWHLPADLQRFKRITLGKPILMGRRTYDSIGRALPGRLNLVLTRNPAWQAPGVIAVHSLEEGFRQVRDATELVVIGGADLFQLMMPLAQRIYLTEIHAHMPGDTLFPTPAANEWRELETRSQAADAHNKYAMTFRTLVRRPP